MSTNVSSVRPWSAANNQRDGYYTTKGIWYTNVELCILYVCLLNLYREFICSCVLCCVGYFVIVWSILFYYPKHRPWTSAFFFGRILIYVKNMYSTKNWICKTFSRLFLRKSYYVSTFCLWGTCGGKIISTVQVFVSLNSKEYTCYCTRLFISQLYERKQY